VPSLPLPRSASPLVGQGGRAVGLMLLSCVFFALMALSVGAAHRADPALDTIAASLYRSAVNLLALVLLVRGDLRALWGDGRPALWIRGLTGAISLISYFGALAHLGIGEAAFLNQTSAFWVAALAPFVLHERTRPLIWLAILGSLVGLALLVEPRDGDLLGRALGLCSGLAAAMAYLSVRMASGSNPPTTIVAWFTGTGTVVCAAWVLLADLPMPREPAAIALLVASGLAATVGQLLMTRAYQLGPAAPVAAAGAAGPLVTTLFGAGLLGQVPDGKAALGMAVLLLSAVLLPFLASRGAPRG
jgi:drug/metabolite transporter (DMT)-like permease